MENRSKRRRKRRTSLYETKNILTPVEFSGDGIQSKHYIPKDSRDGANAMISWVEENVIVSLEIDKKHQSFYMGELPTTVNPITKRPYNYLWEKQKDILRECLQMKDGLFVYTIIVFCWMRGEGKSFLACLIQLWKFFCFERQQIMLGANNRDQSKFVHFGIMQGIVKNSPRLLEQVGGLKNVQEKEIRIINNKGEKVSFISPMSTSTGIVSNITGYTFSEIFAMNNPKFFEELDGSIRNISNALGVIDSTVSPKSHLLYKNLYKGFTDKTLETCYFSHRQSREANYRDYWHPNMTQKQLNDYAGKFSLGGFAQFFKNTWESGNHQVFPLHLIYGMRYFGFDNILGNHEKLLENTRKITDLEDQIEDIDNNPQVKESSLENRMKVMSALTTELSNKVSDIEHRCTPISSLFTLEGNIPQIPDISVIEKLTEIYKTDWSLGVGLDFGDSLAKESKANTMATLILKGLPNSLVDSNLLLEKIGIEVQYLYIMLHIAKIPDHDLDTVKNLVDNYHELFDGVDVIGIEKYRAWDLKNWCIERDISLMAVHPGYPKQKEAFQTVYNAMDVGNLKIPPVGISGVKEPDIVIEEFKTFDHDTFKKWFGSPMKFEKNGIQDDSVYSLAWGIAAMQDLHALNFRKRFMKGLELFYIPPGGQKI
jgi:hypothetical protein